LKIKDKLDKDYNNFNQEIEQASEKELTRIRKEVNDLKDKATKLSEDLSGLTIMKRKESNQEKS
jgi:hypothetical protein